MQAVKFVAPEEAARANLYGLIARLFYAAPDAQLIAELLQAQAVAEPGSELDQHWGAVLDACRHAFPPVLEQEHTELFIGTGKAEITPYLSHYVLRHPGDTPLVALRRRLLEWDMARQEGAHEYEDHVSAVCETMRYVIAVQQRTLAEQKAFFERFVYPGATAFCAAVSASPKARFYAPVARFARAFFDIEKSAFEIGELAD